jgi:hypothetical protein
MLTNPPDRFLDDLGGLTGPDKRRRVFVPVVDHAPMTDPPATSNEAYRLVSPLRA